MTEQGRPIKAGAALSLFANSSAWLRERVDQSAECSCGHCYLCAYNFLARRAAAHKLQTEEIKALDRSHKDLGHRLAEVGRENARLRAALYEVITNGQWTAGDQWGDWQISKNVYETARDAIPEQLTKEAPDGQ